MVKTGIYSNLPEFKENQELSCLRELFYHFTHFETSNSWPFYHHAAKYLSFIITIYLALDISNWVQVSPINLSAPDSLVLFVDDFKILVRCQNSPGEQANTGSHDYPGSSQPQITGKVD